MAARDLTYIPLLSEACKAGQCADCTGKIDKDRPCFCECGHKWTKKKSKPFAREAVTRSKD